MATTDVRVRTETPMLGLAWYEEITLARTPLVEAAIAEGRLTVIDEDGAEAPLRGAALDAALAAAELSTSGTVAEKQARLAEHRAGGGELPEEEGTPATPSTTPVIARTADGATPAGTRA